MSHSTWSVWATATCFAGACAGCVTDGAVLDPANPTLPDAIAPRPIAPLSASIVSVARPVLTWSLPTGVDGARVEICRDRGCTSVLTTFDTQGTHGIPEVDLPPGVSFWRTRAKVGNGVGATPSPAWQLVVRPGQAASGAARRHFFDANGDGYADVVVGESMTLVPSGDYLGRAFVYLGSAAGLAMTPAATLVGPGGVRTAFGRAVADAGDVNGDGFSDVVIGAPSQGDGTGGAPGPGAMFFSPGGPTGIDLAAIVEIDPPANTINAQTNNRFGIAVAGAGDVNGDGYADVVATAPCMAPTTDSTCVGPRALVYFGSAAGLAATPSVVLAADPTRNLWIESVSGVGDVDGDGYDDIALGGVSDPAPAGSGTTVVLDGTGMAYVYRGGPAGPAVTPSFALSRPGGGDSQFGSRVAPAGDLNGDGYADLLVSELLQDAAYAPLAAETFVYLGGPSGPTVLALIDGTGHIGTLGGSEPATSGGESSAVAAAGDLDGDGFDDLAIGVVGPASDGSDANGSFELLPGGSAGIDPSRQRVVDTRTLRQFANTVSGAGDTNGDGYDDVLVDDSCTSPGSTSADCMTGNVYVYSGGIGGPAAPAARTLVSPVAGLFGIGALALAEPIDCVRPGANRPTRIGHRGHRS